MTAFALKMIAIISMFLDHIGYFIYKGHVSFFNYLGRFAFPIFAFQISEGYIHTHNLKKYFSRLFIFALISQIPFTLFLYGVVYQLPISEYLANIDRFELNIFFTLFLGLFSIFLYDKIKEKSKVLGLLAVALICLLGNFIKVDYGYWGILLIFIFYFFKNNIPLTVLAYFTMCLIKYGYQLCISNFNQLYLYLFIGAFLAIIPIILYNGKLGYKTKKLLYIFYPAHLFLIYLATFI